MKFVLSRAQTKQLHQFDLLVKTDMQLVLKHCLLLKNQQGIDFLSTKSIFTKTNKSIWSLH